MNQYVNVMDHRGNLLRIKKRKVIRKSKQSRKKFLSPYAAHNMRTSINLQLGQNQVDVAVHDTNGDSKSKSDKDLCRKKKILLDNVLLSSS